MPVIPIGPFEITEIADRGGMAEVWKGRHATRRVPVALKVLTGPDASHPSFLAAFRNEIRAMAGLDHPHIIQVHDHGVIDVETQRRSEGRLIAGCPYFVMEWASAGNLAIGARPTRWSEVREALLALLGALAHAHARGVIHRDLKRQNVLLCGGDDLRPGWKLADFGMARPPGSDADPLAGGTPGLMAPEQSDGRWRDQGAWTDLFALGCLSWTLVTGRRATALPGPQELRDDPPADTPVVVPRGFWDWIARLTEVHPHDRPAFAATARTWLLALPEVSEELEDPTEEVDRALVEAEHASEPTRGNTRTLVMVANPAASRGRPAGQPDFRIPIPVDWRERGAAAAQYLNGVGLSLFGLRQLPLVGREVERDRLWQGLCVIASTGRPRCVILRGAAGTGKSRLASWLACRAHEVGAAASMTATHMEDPSASEGLGAMVARTLGCAGLEGAELLERLSDLVAEEVIPEGGDVIPLADLIAPGPDGPLSGEQMHRSREAARRLLVARAARSPVIVCLDDAQWDAGVVDFAGRLLETQAPIYVLLCVRDEDLARRPEVGSRLVELAGRAEVSMIDVRPLTGVAWRSLVRELLGLDGALAAQLEERAGGNPLFAVHLVGDWVARGVLIPGDDGFRLAPHVQVELPENLRAVWKAHIEAVLAGRPAAEGIALERAAVLGTEVVVEEWQAALKFDRLPLPTSRVEALIARRLAWSGVQGPQVRWSFVHAILRESFISRAQEAGRLAAHHRACARMLEERGPHPLVVERHGRHLLLAGELEAALEPLLRSTRARLALGERDLAAALIADCNRAIEQAGLPPGQRERVEVAILGAELAGMRGEYIEEARCAREAAKLACEHRWSALEARALYCVGLGALDLGDLDEALSLFQSALSLAVRSEDASVEAAARAAAGRVLVMLGDHAEGVEALQRAERTARALGHPAGLAAAFLGLSAAAREVGDGARASSLARTALGFVETGGWKSLLVRALVAVGDAARLQGELGAAETWYRTATDRSEGAAEGDAAPGKLGLGLVHLERGQWALARRPLLEALDIAIRRDRKVLELCARVALLAPAILADDVEGWDRHIVRARFLARRTRLVDVDLRRYTQLAVKMAIEAGQPARAAAAAELLTRLEMQPTTALSA